MRFENIILHPGGSGHRQDRHSGWDTGWRSLPVCLLETPEKGQWIVETETRSWVIVANQSFFIPSGLRHRLRSRCDRGMRSSWCMLNWEWRGQVLRFMQEPVILRGEAIREGILLLSELNKTTEMDLETCARMQEVGLTLLMALRDRVEAGRMDDRIRRAVERMTADLAAPHTVAALAKVAGLSVSRFHELFLAQVGETPVQYVKGLRIRKAMELLSHSALPQAEIAEMCGFQSLPYFNRAFRAVTGLPPGRFRAS
jgi:AraC-like DNA-binding protein